VKTAAVVTEPSAPALAIRRPTSNVRRALLGTLLAVGFLLLDVYASGHGILRPIRAGAKGPGAALIARDFPKLTAPDEVGLDGQQFYAIARDPFHPDAVAKNLDNPQYRYSRPLYPLLAWALHPSGGGPGLVLALVAVSLLGIFLGSLAVALLSDHLRGPTWLPLLFPILPGATWSLTSSVADGLAVALSLLTVLFFVTNRSKLAWCAAVAAVLTRETTILVPLALFLSSRRKEDLPVVVLPAVAFATWFAFVHLVVPAGGLPSEHLVFPLSGLVDAARERWFLGKELIGMASTVSAFVIGTYVVVRRRGPVELRWVVAVQLGFLSLCSGAVLGDDFGGPRSTLMLLTVALALLVAGSRDRYLASTSARVS
jgi:hypothetical protein